MSIPNAPFDHLLNLSDSMGLFEHAEFTRARREHGYCLDDVARGLLVVVREPEPPQEVRSLGWRYLAFVCEAQDREGRFHNRRGVDGSWQDETSVEDCWGRALWALGAAGASGSELAGPARRCFDRGVKHRSPWPRAMAFAALGAAEVLRAAPRHAEALALLRDAVVLIGSPRTEAHWRWPESRLHYANATLPQALLVAGGSLGDNGAVSDGLAMLSWLCDVETFRDHVSPTPVGGWLTGEPRPAFDQQPIEVAALADACADAYRLTGDPRWKHEVLRAAAWFLGDNDTGVPLFDPTTGGGCDGLHRDRRNENQGAESTLAMISTFQLAHRMPALR